MAESGIIEMDVGLTQKTKTEIDTYHTKVTEIKDILNESEKKTKSRKSRKSKRKSKRDPSTHIGPENMAFEDPNEGYEEEDIESAEDTVNRLVEEIIEDEKEDERKDTIEKKRKRAKLDKTSEQILTDPKSFIADQVREQLLKQFEDVLESIPVIALAILAVKVAQYVLDEFVQKGGPFNRDFRRFIQQEVDIGLTRELVKMRELGIGGPTIFAQTRGWVPHNENWTYNSLFQVNASRIARIGLDDKSAGVVAF